MTIPQQKSSSLSRKICSPRHTEPTVRSNLLFPSSVFHSSTVCGVEQLYNCSHEAGFHSYHSFPTAEIILFDNIISVYRSAADIYLYVIGSADENELILASVLTSLYETLSILLR